MQLTSQAMWTYTKFHTICFYKFVFQSDGAYFDFNMYLIDGKSLNSF